VTKQNDLQVYKVLFRNIVYGTGGTCGGKAGIAQGGEPQAISGIL